MITEISYTEILHIWQHYLWTDRKSAIEPNSAMCFLGGYSMYNMTTKPTFFAYLFDDEIAGVNSGHMCENNQYRSRGLFVFDNYRNNGIGCKLLKATIEQGKIEGATMCWSYPRDTSWKTYASAGFKLVSDFEISETGNNAYCRYDY